MNRYPLPIFLLALAVALTVVACQPAGDASSSGDRAVVGQNDPYDFDMNSKPNVLRIAVESEAHTTLAAAIKAAELEQVLISAGPLTVFAPTNDAFAALPPGTVEELLKPENKRTLATIVTSHASPGTFVGRTLQDGQKIYLATGQYVDVEMRDGDTYVHGAKILGTVSASNGVVHVVDKVFLFE